MINQFKAMVAPVLFFVATAVPTSSIASSDIQCVQQALLDAGHDPNGVDGAVGRGTKAAATSFLEATGLSLPVLSSKTAEIWCRSLTIAPAVLAEMSAICSVDVDIAGQDAIVGEWYYTEDVAFGYGVFIREVSDDGKVKGHYATPLIDPWNQGKSCVFFSGSIDDNGSLRFLTSNNGRVTRVVPNFGENTKVDGTYINKVDWRSTYGNTDGWARVFKAN